MQHCSGVAAAVAGTAGIAEGIVGEETIEEIGYGEIGFLCWTWKFHIAYRPS